MMPAMKTFTLLLFPALLPAQAMAGHLLGEPVERAAAVHITNGGLDHLGDAIEKLVPTSFPITGLSGELACSEDDPTSLLTYRMDDLEVLISADDVQVVVSDGRIDVNLYGTLSSSASQISVTGDCSILTDLAEVCSLQLPTTALWAHLGLQLAQVDGVFDATVDDVSLTISPVTNPISGCTLSSAIGTLLGQNPFFVNDLIDSYLDPALVDVGPSIEEPLEEALNSLVLDLELPIGDPPIALSLSPSRVDLGADGIILGLGATVSGTVSDCVDGSQGSDFSDAPWPAFSESPEGSSLKYDVGVVVSQDFVDHALYAVWASGLLCQDLADLNGAAITTSLLGTLLGLTDPFSSLFPEDQPALLSVDPVEPPYVIFGSDDPPISAAIDGLGISMVTALDARDMVLFHLDTTATIGVSVTLNTSEVAAGVLIDPNAITFRETSNELLPSGFSDNLVDLIPTLLDMFGASTLSFSYALPDLMGVGIGATYWIPSPDGEWQGLYANLDLDEVQPIDMGGCQLSTSGCEGGSTDEIDIGALLGCSEDSGCDSGSGCEESSCSTSGPRIPARALMALALVLAAALRRRAR